MQGQLDLPTLLKTMTIAANLSLLCLMMILINEPPNSTSNIARASTMVINSTRIAKFEGRDATGCGRDPRQSNIRVSNYVRPQMIQLRDLDQAVPETTLSSIFKKKFFW